MLPVLRAVWMAAQVYRPNVVVAGIDPEVAKEIGGALIGAGLRLTRSYIPIAESTQAVWSMVKEIDDSSKNNLSVQTIVGPVYFACDKSEPWCPAGVGIWRFF